MKSYIKLCFILLGLLTVVIKLFADNQKEIDEDELEVINDDIVIPKEEALGLTGYQPKEDDEQIGISGDVAYAKCFTKKATIPLVSVVNQIDLKDASNGNFEISDYNRTSFTPEELKEKVALLKLMKGKLCKQMRNLNSLFKSQCTATWKTLGKVIAPVLADVGRTELVLFVAPPSSESTMQKITATLANVVRKIMDVPPVSTRKAIQAGSYRTADKFIKDIYQRLKQEKIVIVDNIQNMNSDTAPALLSLLDLSIVPVRGLVILTVSSHNEGPYDFMKAPDELVCGYLATTWGGILNKEILEKVMEVICETSILIYPEENHLLVYMSPDKQMYCEYVSAKKLF